MHWKEDLRKTKTWKEFFPAFIIVANSMVWNVFVLEIFSGMIIGVTASANDALTFLGLEYLGVAVSAILGAMIFPRSKRFSLFLWMLIGGLASSLLASVPTNTFQVNVLVSLAVGISMGAGLPSSLAYFADATRVENRGLFGGITFLSIGIFSIAFVMITLSFNDTSLILATSLWRVGGAIIFLFLCKDRRTEKQHMVPSFSKILHRKDLILYLVPWLMFCLVNEIEAPLLENLFGNFFSIIGFIEVIIAGVFALIGGIIADFAGRKRVIIIGFIVLGLDYALLSLLSGIQISWYIYAVLDSVAWGMFAAVFFMTLWGDLAKDQQKDRYYVVGGLPYVLTIFLSDFIRPYVGIMPLVTAFSLASFFLFLAVLPLMYAPETLPEAKIKERELKTYIVDAEKIKEKYA